MSSPLFPYPNLEREQLPVTALDKEVGAAVAGVVEETTKRAGLSHSEQWLLNMFESSSEQALIGGLEEIRDRNLKKELSQIRAKIRIFHGVADVLVYPWLAKNQKV